MKRSKQSSKTNRATIAAKRVFILGCIALWILVIIFALWVLNKGGQLTPKAQETVIAEGQVIDEGGKGIGGARVTILKDGVNSYLLADSQGRFATRSAGDATYHVTIEAKGYKNSSSAITFTEGNKSFFIYSLSK